MGCNVRFSEEEAMAFGLRIGRAICDDFEAETLIRSIHDLRLDVLRLRLNHTNEVGLEQLMNLGIPVAMAGKIARYRISVENMEVSKFVHDSTRFEVYDGSCPQVVSDLVMRSCADDPIGYYRTPPLDKLIGKHKETEYMAWYYATKYVTPQKQLWILYFENSAVGFVASTFTDTVMDTDLAVVLPELRGKKLLHEIMIARNNYAVAHQLKWITNGARHENPTTNHVFAKFGMLSDGVDHVIHLMPMLSFNRPEHEGQ